MLTLKILLVTSTLLVLGYWAGRVDGVNVGYAVAYSEQAARASEHDRVMQYVGVCKWAKIVADDIRCKTELP